MKRELSLDVVGDTDIGISLEGKTLTTSLTLKAEIVSGAVCEGVVETESTGPDADSPLGETELHSDNGGRDCDIKDVTGAKLNDEVSLAVSTGGTTVKVSDDGD